MPLRDAKIGSVLPPVICPCARPGLLLAFVWQASLIRKRKAHHHGPHVCDGSV